MRYNNIYTHSPGPLARCRDSSQRTCWRHRRWSCWLWLYSCHEDVSPPRLMRTCLAWWKQRQEWRLLCWIACCISTMNLMLLLDLWPEIIMRCTNDCRSSWCYKQVVDYRQLVVVDTDKLQFIFGAKSELKRGGVEENKEFDEEIMRKGILCLVSIMRYLYLTLYHR